MTRTFTCIICPNGCEITVEYDPDMTDISIQGASCPRGKEYVRQELIEPRRTIASSAWKRSANSLSRVSRPVSL